MSRRNEIQPPVKEPHRIELVRNVRGVSYVNDAKAKNENMVWYAIECCNGPVVLITTGSDLVIGTNYTFLRPIVKEKVKLIISIGRETNKLNLAFGSILGRIIVTDNLFEALFIAKRHTEPEDFVLYSPLTECKDFLSNGLEYKNIVNQINF